MERVQKICAAKAVFDNVIQKLSDIRDGLGEVFVYIEEEIIKCNGKVILCGMGKSGHIGRKIAATLASLGTPSFFLHPAEAMHGDLGMVSQNDIIILISNSGETEEILRILPSLKLIGVKTIAITGKRDSTLAKECDITQLIEITKEACALNLAPTTSTTAALVYGDALAVVTSIETGFGESDFGVFHPAGALGKKVLRKVRDIMAKGDDIPLVYSGSKITDTIIEMSNKQLGVVAVVDRDCKLIGILTDGDLRRAIEKRADLYTNVIESIMTNNPKYIYDDMLVVDALQRLKNSRLNNYPVIDKENKVIGMLTWQMIIREGIVL